MHAGSRKDDLGSFGRHIAESASRVELTKGRRRVKTGKQGFGTGHSAEHTSHSFDGMAFAEAVRRHGDERTHHEAGLGVQGRALHGSKGRERNSGKHSGPGKLFEERTAVDHKHL
jgi:hypothetical protein